MTDTIRTEPATRPDTPSHRGRTVGMVALGLLLVAAFFAWVGLGTLSAAKVVQERASAAQSELALFHTTLQTGDSVGAKAHLQAGARALTQAQDAANRPQVRIAKYLPYVGRTVRDLDHLLAAAKVLSGAGSNALELYTQFSGANSKLFSHDTFSIPAIRRASAAVGSLSAALDTARRDLNQVTGTGPRGAQALEKKKLALKQVESLSRQTRDLGPLLQAMPAAVGANGPRTYLVTVLNPAEARAPGGAPLSVAFLRLDQGRLSIPIQGQTSVLTRMNAPHLFTPASGDPWLQGRAERRFVNANVNPDFSIAGEQLARASSQFRQKPDGVIALDVQAIGKLLAVTGPIQSAQYGQLTSANAVQKLVIDAYLQPMDQAVRHEQNDQLMSTMLQRLTQGGGLIGKARALGQAIPGRHLQLYFRDPALEKIVDAAHAGGRVTTVPVGDLAAAYTQNMNGSKVDTYQHRTLKETITLAADGSATVRRTVVIANRTPPYTGGGTDPRFGYYTRWSILRVINLMTPGSSTTAQPTPANSPGFLAGTAQHKGTDGEGRPYADAVAQIPPGGTAQLTWQYRLPKAAVRDGKNLRLLIHAQTQPIVVPPNLQVTVIAPTGWTAQVGPGWTKTANGASATETIDQNRLLQLVLTPGG